MLSHVLVELELLASEWVNERGDEFEEYINSPWYYACVSKGLLSDLENLPLMIKALPSLSG